jgi:hypothetical protein
MILEILFGLLILIRLVVLAHLETQDPQERLELKVLLEHQDFHLIQVQRVLKVPPDPKVLRVLKVLMN